MAGPSPSTTSPVYDPRLPTNARRSIQLTAHRFVRRALQPANVVAPAPSPSRRFRKADSAFRGRHSASCARQMLAQRSRSAPFLATLPAKKVVVVSDTLLVVLGWLGNFVFENNCVCIDGFSLAFPYLLYLLEWPRAIVRFLRFSVATTRPFAVQRLRCELPQFPQRQDDRSSNYV